ncbi:hypothetical protein D3C86_1403810 [compost metagenome]
MAAHLRVARIVDGRLRDVRRRGVLGHEVDHAARAGAAGRHAVQEGAGATEHFHALQPFRCHQLARRDAEQAVVLDIVGRQLEAAHHEGVREVAKAVGGADRRVVGQHAGNAARLLVLDLLGRVRRHAERHIHEVLVAQHAKVAAARNLAAGIGGGQLVCRGVGMHGHGGQRGAFRRGGWLGRLLGEGDGRQHAGSGQCGHEMAQRRAGRTSGTRYGIRQGDTPKVKRFHARPRRGSRRAGFFPYPSGWWRRSDGGARSYCYACTIRIAASAAATPMPIAPRAMRGVTCGA